MINFMVMIIDNEEEYIPSFEDCAEKDLRVSGYLIGDYGRKYNYIFEKTDTKTDKILGVDYILRRPGEEPVLIDFKHGPSAFFFGLATNGKLSVNHPWKKTTESDEMLVSCFILKLSLWFTRPLIKAVFMTRREYMLQYVKDDYSLDLMLEELDKWHFRSSKHLNGQDTYDFILPKIIDYLKPGVTVAKFGNKVQLISSMETMRLYVQYCDSDKVKMPKKYYTKQ